MKYHYKDKKVCSLKEWRELPHTEVVLCDNVIARRNGDQFIVNIPTTYIHDGTDFLMLSLVWIWKQVSYNC